MTQTILMQTLVTLLVISLLLTAYTRFRNSTLKTSILISKYISYLNVLLSLGLTSQHIYSPKTEFIWSFFPGGNPVFQLDNMGASLLIMVSILGLVVAKFSRSYLEGDEIHKRFIGRIAGVIASVQFLILSANLVVFFLSWLLTSWFLQRLILTYRNSPKAKLAARKKFILARIGDSSLLIAFTILFNHFNTLNISAIIQSMHTIQPDLPIDLTLAACCLVLTAVLKAAQFPLHGWLIEVMDAPTPVSAILHAGLINAGPFLILRFAPLISASSAGTLFLFSIALISAIFGALVFAHQPSVKNSLGYSSIAHLGFTLLLCSIGLYSAALLHLIAHSFFKAYQFLSSGSEIDRNRSVIQMHSGKPRTQTTIMKVVLLSITLSFVLVVVRMNTLQHFSLLVLFLFFLLAITIYMIRLIPSLNSWKTYAGALLFIAVLLGSFYGFEGLFGLVLLKQIHLKPTFLQETLLVTAVCIMLMLIIFRPILLNSDRFRRNLTVHLRNGFYINILLNRAFGAYAKK